MKTLIISDTHLTHRFNHNKFDYLKNLITQADKVIINGDFWDDYLTTFEKFIDSQWNQLFPLLKNKHTIYIKGNHDEHTPETALELFCDEMLLEYKLPVGNKILHITHGQEAVRYLNKIHVFIDKITIFHRPIGWIVNILIFITNKKYLKVAYQKMNNEMNLWAQNHLQSNEILVCGHSHLQEINIENQFVNLGANTNGLKQYAIVENNTISFYSNGKIIQTTTL